VDDDFMSMLNKKGDDDDLFAAFSGSEPVPDTDDPFAALDAGIVDDPFAGLTAARPEEDLFGSPRAPAGAKAPAAPADADLFPADAPGDDVLAGFDSGLAAADGERPAWLREYGGEFEEEAEELEPEEPKKKGRARRRQGSVLSKMVGQGPRGVSFGMTAQQRMVLSIFLFLDTAVLGFMVLLAIGAISF
jgi:hypothetical protein